jgi:hypothetical protein
MTKLMEQAIAYLKQLEPDLQDEMAHNLLGDDLADLSKTERRDIVERLAEAEDDLRLGRCTEGEEAFWAGREMNAQGGNRA